MPPAALHRAAPTATALLAVLALVVALLVGGLGASPAGATDGAAGPSTGPEAPSRSQARAALQHALAVMAPRGTGRAARRAGAAGRALTPALRDLVLAMPALRGEDRTTARSLLARPTDGVAVRNEPKYGSNQVRRRCDPRVCVHWVETGGEAVDTTDTDADGVADWVETTQAAMATVWDVEVGALGYRAPRSDLGSSDDGGDGRLDVYLADVGDSGVYGYCTTDDPGARSRFVVSAYCVLDNDFAATQFDGADPQDSLDVTAAHEFFHAVQFGYDYVEDGWLLEGTATWVEDRVHDDVDDNHQYLDDSALANPYVPLDRARYGEQRQYGTFLFWEYLTEHLGASPGPLVVRQVWEKADARRGAPDLSSTAAVAAVAAQRGSSYRQVFGDFASANLTPRTSYAEGAGYDARQPGGAPLAKRFRLTRTSRDSEAWSVTLNHQTSANARFVPDSSLTGAWRLQVALDLPPTATGSQARLLITRTDGRLERRTVSLDDRGDRSLRVPFSPSSVRHVTLTLANASTRFRCWQGTFFSCQGIPRDDEEAFVWAARAVR